MNNKPDSKVEVKACEHKMCTVLGSGHKWCTECGAFKTFPDEAYWRMPSKPIANNGVSFDSIVDKLTHLNGDHLMGLELNNIHIIANFITKLPTTAPRGGNMIDVVKKAVESGAVVIKPCTANCLNGIITDHEGAEVRDIVCPTCSGREYVITEGEVSRG